MSILGARLFTTLQSEKAELRLCEFAQASCSFI
jgi:hypothetical protein